MTTPTIDALWKGYQIGQGSADHTAKEVFAEVIGPVLRDLVAAQEELKEAQEKLAAARAGIAQLKADLAARDAELASVKAERDALKERIWQIRVELGALFTMLPNEVPGLAMEVCERDADRQCLFRAFELAAHKEGA